MYCAPSTLHPTLVCFHPSHLTYPLHDALEVKNKITLFPEGAYLIYRAWDIFGSPLHVALKTERGIQLTPFLTRGNKFLFEPAAYGSHYYQTADSPEALVRCIPKLFHFDLNHNEKMLQEIFQSSYYVGIHQAFKVELDLCLTALPSSRPFIFFDPEQNVFFWASKDPKKSIHLFPLQLTWDNQVTIDSRTFSSISSLLSQFYPKTDPNTDAYNPWNLKPDGKHYIYA